MHISYSHTHNTHFHSLHIYLVIVNLQKNGPFQPRELSSFWSIHEASKTKKILTFFKLLENFDWKFKSDYSVCVTAILTHFEQQFYKFTNYYIEFYSVCYTVGVQYAI